jgi:beta-phosphoglucomutase
MRWLRQFDLFLFDFDGLLVNTEEIHFLAYKKMCAHYGIDLVWDFNRYCQSAHYKSDKMRQDLQVEFPALFSIEPHWDVLYAKKKEIVLDLLFHGSVHLMPGVEKLLCALKEENIPSCVVTHSANELIAVVRSKNPVLNTITHWVTREHYHYPKPNPECYFKAIEMISSSSDRIVGFEDAPRGVEALLHTRVKPVMICEAKYPEIPAFLNRGVSHFSSLEQIPSEGF